MNKRAITLLELVLFGSLAMAVLGAVIGLLARGSKVTELGRRTSASLEELRVLMEILSRDAEELAYLEKPDEFDSSNGSGEFELVARSDSDEPGLPPQTGATLRKIVYRLGPPSGPDNLRPLTRRVTIAPQGGSGAADAERQLALQVKRLRVEPLVSAPRIPRVPDQPLQSLLAAADPVAKGPGAAVLCLLVDAEIGRATGGKTLEQSAAIAVATKLWCRDRLLELPRGGRE